MLLKPTHVLYTAVSRFLLQRPYLDLTDVPLLYNLLNSPSHSDFRQERSWILRLLYHGLNTKLDHHVYRRRHVYPTTCRSLFDDAPAFQFLHVGIASSKPKCRYELLMSFYDAPYADTFTRRLVLQLFEKGASAHASSLKKCWQQ